MKQPGGALLFVAVVLCADNSWLCGGQGGGAIGRAFLGGAAAEPAATSGTGNYDRNGAAGSSAAYGDSRHGYDDSHVDQHGADDQYGASWDEANDRSVTVRIVHPEPGSAWAPWARLNLDVTVGQVRGACASHGSTLSSRLHDKAASLGVGAM